MEGRPPAGRGVGADRGGGGLRATRLATNDSAVQVLGDEQLRTIARELAEDGARERDHSLDGAGERAGQSAGASASGCRAGMGIRPKAERKRRERMLEQAELWGKEWAA
jgi:hypothetical protein